ncbi:CASP-like protein 4A3 [Malania oleifera]|uniref:CASP-like protein 4A3 n=1 Tax=Malania oleifera TaxID=397392 RepID=UPI0025AE94A8|nr:CASP-like protein 4A3 [Malania oleifera]
MQTRENRVRNNSLPDSVAQKESPHSPLRAHSPFRSDDPDPPFSTPESSPAKSPCKAVIALEKHTRSYAPEQQVPAAPPPQPAKANVTVTAAAPAAVPENAAPEKPQDLSRVVVVNRSVREEDMAATVTKVGPGLGGGGGREDGGGERRSARTVTAILGRSRREIMVRRAALGFRVCEMVLCLISFSVMAADKTQGWSGDSFDRYKEYRYCLSVTVIAFVYSGFQAYDLAYHLITGKHVIRHHLRCHFNFFMDQVLAYLLISASSSAATRVDDWQSNWGKDEFTEMASASVGMSFLAFAAFALSSLISGYDLCTRDLT